MGISKKKVWILISLMVAALSGLIALQGSLLVDALELKEQAFRRNVLAAMSAVASDLETAETAAAALSYMVGSDGRTTIAARLLQTSDSASLSPDDSMFVQVEIRHEMTSDDSTLSGHMIWRRHGADGKLDTVRVDTILPSVLSGMRSIRANLETQNTVVSDTTIVMVVSNDSLRYDDILSLASDSGKLTMIDRVVSRLFMSESQPVQERIDREHLDSLVKHNLQEFGIDLVPAYGVYSVRGDSLWLVEPSEYKKELASAEFRTRLFQYDLFGPPNELVMLFPDRGNFLWQQIGPLTALTISFMLVIIGGFAYTVRTIIAQRRSSRLMVDFVNNMTHEFRTPISTIALACEAILRPDVLPDREKVTRFSEMILEENRRMRNQAEKILQMATLEEKEGQLKLSEVDLHEVIDNAVKSVTLRVEQCGGQITCQPGATDHIIMADPIHLTAVIGNLLDNANKYSPANPEITIVTRNVGRTVVVGVEDKGIGIKPEDVKRIFDKYFRVSSGNTHDVKGFGLGLSYVRLIVKAHGGQIEVDSHPGRGTRIELILPVIAKSGSTDEAIS